MAEKTFSEQSDSIVEDIKPLLAGKPAVLQGSVLAELVAIWLAGFYMEGDEGATNDLRTGLLNIHLDTVRELISHYTPILQARGLT